MKQHRSVRGSLCSRVKECLFKHFGLNPINSKASHTEVENWKGQIKVKESFSTLFKSDKSEKTHMVQILENLWPKDNIKNISKVLIAYAVGICEILLDPDNRTIQITEADIKNKIRKNVKKLVSFMK